jgi:hypothetical protein
MSARWRPAARRPIGQFCAHEGWLHGVPVAAPNGGSGAAAHRRVVTERDEVGPRIVISLSWRGVAVHWSAPAGGSIAT